MCGVIIVYSNGCDTFIGLLSLARNHNATVTVVDHWDAHLGLRLSRKELFSTLTSRPKLKEGLRPSISFTAIFTALSLECGSLASLNFEKILSQKITCLSRIIFVILPIFLYFEMVQDARYHRRSFPYQYDPGAQSRQACHTSYLHVD